MTEDGAGKGRNIFRPYTAPAEGRGRPPPLKILIRLFTFGTRLIRIVAAVAGFACRAGFPIDGCPALVAANRLIAERKIEGQVFHRFTSVAINFYSGVFHSSPLVE